MEKQRLRAQYNVRERQLRNYARTIFAARQLVVHGHVTLNGRRVSFPSHAVKVGDEMALTEKARAIPQVVMAMEAARAPSYLELRRD